VLGVAVVGATVVRGDVGGVEVDAVVATLVAGDDAALPATREVCAALVWVGEVTVGDATRSFRCWSGSAAPSAASTTTSVPP